MPRFVIKGFAWEPALPFELDEGAAYAVVPLGGGGAEMIAIPTAGFPFAFEAELDFDIRVSLPGIDEMNILGPVGPSVPVASSTGSSLERTFYVTYRPSGGEATRAELYVYYTLEDDRAGLTTPPALPDRVVREIEEEKGAPLTLSSSASSSSSSSSSNRLDDSDPFRYLVMPGNYSGDSWAVAFALLLDDRVKVALPTKPDGAEGIFRRTTLQFADLCAALRIGDFEKRVLIDTSLTGQQVGESTVAKVGEAVIASDITMLKQPPELTFCGWTFASSSVIMRAAERRGLAVVLGEIRAAVTRGVTLTEHLGGVLGKIASVEACVLINMRIGRRGNHPQHDINFALYTQIAEAVTAAGYTAIRVGTYQNSEFTPGGQWMRGLTTPMVEIFPPGEAANRQQIATFWYQVAQLPNVLGIIGGRSGSLDIAAIMGVRTLCWDIVDPYDQEYIRQLLYAPFMSICPRSGGELTTTIKNKTEPMPGHLSAAALSLWLAGHAVVPRRKVDPDGVYLQLFKLALLRDAEARKRIFLRTVAFMRMFQGGPAAAEDDDDEEIVDALPTGYLDEAAETVTASDGSVFDVGQAPGGGNCFYHCVAQIVNDGRDHAQLRTALAGSGNVAEGARVGTDGEDATDGDITGMTATLHRPIVIHTVGYHETRTQEQTIGSHEAGAAIHILHRYDPIDGRGHYDPMRPQG